MGELISKGMVRQSAASEVNIDAAPTRAAGPECDEAGRPDDPRVERPDDPAGEPVCGPSPEPSEPAEPSVEPSGPPIDQSEPPVEPSGPPVDAPEPQDLPIVAGALPAAVGPNNDTSLVYKRASAVTPLELEWLWPGRIPLAKITLIAGDPGLGKSLIGVDLAARASSGRPMPGEQEATIGGGAVVMISAEDDPRDTLVPRLCVAGAELDNVYFFTGRAAPAGTGGTWPFRLDLSLTDLDEMLSMFLAPRLVVIDPVSAFMGEHDANSNQHVREALSALGSLGDKHGCAIVLISHLNKSSGSRSVYRVMGSLAFPAAARVVWQVDRDPDAPMERLMSPVKMNLARECSAMRYRVEDEAGYPRLEWLGESDIRADDLQEGAREQLGAREEAEQMLALMLGEGPASAGDVLRQARELGLSEHAVRSARKRLGVRIRREGFGKGARYLWEMGTEVAGPSEPLYDAHASHG